MSIKRLLAFCTLITAAYPLHADVFMANGMKIGDVTSDTAKVWTRLTAQPERTRSGTKFLKTTNPTKEEPARADGSHQFPPGKTLADMEGSVPGADGEVRLRYWPKGQRGNKTVTDWMRVDSQKDFTRQFSLTGLSANTDYVLEAEGKDASSTVAVDGGFRTAPKADDVQDIDFVVVTCGDYPRRDDAENGHVIYETMLKKIDPHFFVHTGDIEYYDRDDPYALSKELARYKMNRLFSMPYIRSFHNNVSSYFIKDDHDTLMDDCDPDDVYGTLTWDEGIAIFEEQFPRTRPYKTVRWGKDLQVWMMEGRDFRDVHPEGPDQEPSIWGAQQKEWFFKSFAESDATFRVLISPTPVVGPDRKGKNDNHANKEFAFEGNQIREFLGSQENAFVICGDRHWQYHSVDPTTGATEFSCGPSSDKHASGYSEEFRNEYHKYLKILGGFLSVNVSRETGEPVVTFNHHAPDGTVRYSFQKK
ncbi:PhoD-like phosphatase [Rubripirellula tenax]|uniref:PhoD-like phosphatase n=1 Tax=Rubripirellula tenax TaxID=2528015 RepID=A0A5C6EZU2_9BACT|nr:alkaline phosphatase D family protein [Rubripirellula tenax]TWU54325.1 PhoD-like phosphatase [Rubripirellula tenax]